MEEPEKQHIQNNQRKLPELMRANAGLFAEIEQAGILDISELADLNSILSEYTKTKEMLEILKGKSNGYAILLSAVTDTKQTGAEAILRQLPIQQRQQENPVQAKTFDVDLDDHEKVIQKQDGKEHIKYTLFFCTWLFTVFQMLPIYLLLIAVIEYLRNTLHHELSKNHILFWSALALSFWCVRLSFFKTLRERIEHALLKNMMFWINFLWIMAAASICYSVLLSSVIILVAVAVTVDFLFNRIYVYYQTAVNKEWVINWYPVIAPVLCMILLICHLTSLWLTTHELV